MAACPDPDSGGSAVLSFVTGRDAYLPSDLVPKTVVAATCEMARELLIEDRTVAPPGEGLVSDRTSTAGKKFSKTDVRPIIPRLVQSLLAKYGVPVRRGNSTVRLVRA